MNGFDMEYLLSKGEGKVNLVQCFTNEITRISTGKSRINTFYALNFNILNIALYNWNKTLNFIHLLW